MKSYTISRFDIHKMKCELLSSHKTIEEAKKEIIKIFKDHVEEIVSNTEIVFINRLHNFSFRIKVEESKDEN